MAAIRFVGMFVFCATGMRYAGWKNFRNIGNGI